MLLSSVIRIINPNGDPWGIVASFIILLTVREGKINMGNLPGKFVIVPDAFNFLSIAPMVILEFSCNMFL